MSTWHSSAVGTASAPTCLLDSASSVRRCSTVQRARSRGYPEPQGGAGAHLVDARLVGQARREPAAVGVLDEPVQRHRHPRDHPRHRRPPPSPPLGRTVLTHRPAGGALLIAPGGALLTAP